MFLTHSVERLDPHLEPVPKETGTLVAELSAKFARYRMVLHDSEAA